jgi:hypothetical protein
MIFGYDLTQRLIPGHICPRERLIFIISSHFPKMYLIYVGRGLCLIYMFSFYFWSPSLARKMRKINMRYYPEYPSRSWHPILAP